MRPLEILVIDDEPILLHALKRSLLRAGYRCEVAADIDAARDAFRRRGRHVDAVLVDWGLPDRSAAALVDEFWTLRPELPVVLTSSAAPWELPPGARARPFHSFLPKPFSPEELLLSIARAAGRDDRVRAMTE